MSLRRRFILSLLALAVAVSATVGVLAWREASAALEEELDRRAEWVARAAADVGLQATLLVALEPGFEDTSGWTSTNRRLMQLRSIVSEAYVIRDDNTAIVTSLPADSIPIGAPLPQFDVFGPELEEARTVGYATTLSFPFEGRLYKWGFAALDDQRTVLAVLMPADYLVGLEQLRRDLIVTSIVAALVAVLLAVLLAASVVRPMERLSRVALRIQRGHMEVPVAEEGPHEVGMLSRAMEGMREGILERDERLRLMLAQVAHEIRNPLGGLELFAAAAAEADDPVERNRLIGRVREEVAALNVIISDFLTFARPIEPSAEAVDVRQPVREAAELVGAELEERGGSLDVSMPDGPLLARAEVEHVKRATLNLLRNAAQASNTVRLRAALDNAEVVISVSDDGPGIPEDLRGRVFDPFVTDKEQGAGLGLAIVKKVAEANGGRVELMDPQETNGGRGAEFRVYFGSLEDPPAALLAE